MAVRFCDHYAHKRTRVGVAQGEAEAGIMLYVEYESDELKKMRRVWQICNCRSKAETILLDACARESMAEFAFEDIIQYCTYIIILLHS